MATRDLHYASKKLAASTSSLASRLLLSILCLVPLFLCFSLFRDYTESPSLTYSVVSEKSNSKCNYSDGRWIYDPTVRSPPRYDHTCKEIFKAGIASPVTNPTPLIFSSGAGNRTDVISRPLIRCGSWRTFEIPILTLWIFNSAGFVGDSLNRNMFVSLFCALKQASTEVKKWRPVGADRGFTFLKYNVTIAYHRTNLLARYGRWSASSNGGKLESLGYKEGYRIDVDLPEGTWAEAPSFHDILIFNTGHCCWYGLYFSLKLNALAQLVSYVEKNARPSTILFFRTQSPRHFENGDWNQGGSCPRLQPLVPQELEQLFSLKNNGTNVETRLVNQHLHKALKGSSFHILDITHMSESRADAHPSTAGGKRHDDCMHWDAMLSFYELAFTFPGICSIWASMALISGASNTEISRFKISTSAPFCHFKL
ncbi:UNVERIFIED_CONTAM: protein trichome birefringence-like 13 [Sesamum radiatum]|uniref:Protein trichome birefringence-like 13 n=1 Tax=Sesamum radiatum TaxID=300843 RepID=A0AAW2MWW2_SESRA